MKTAQWLATLLCGGLLVGLAPLKSAQAIPAYARKYDADCSMCHTVYPRLNPVGHKFRRLGYRMPEEFDNREVTLSAESLKRLSNYFSARGRARGTYANSNDDPDDFDLEMHDVTLFYTGPVTRNIGFFFELPFEPEEGNAFLEVGQINLVFGQSNNFFFSRIGQVHQFSRVGYGGLDRPIGLANPRVFDVRVNGFRPRHDGVAVEGGWSNGNFTGLVQITNGIQATGGSVLDNEDPNNHKDLAALFEYVVPDKDSSLSLLYVFGQAPTPLTDADGDGAVDDTIPGATNAKYNRFYAFADYTFEPLGLKPLIGGGLGFDNQFITGLGSTGAALVSANTNRSYFIFAELDQRLRDNLYAVARLDIDDVTNQAEAAGATRRTWMGSGGLVWSFQQFLRLSGEYQAVDNAAQAVDHQARLEAQFNF